MIGGSTAMTATYDGYLVTLSFVIAIIASYTALDLAGRVTAAQRRARLLWLTGGAIAMGVGIWSMHFIAMLAYNLPLSITYGPLTVLASMAGAVVASGAALFVVSRKHMGNLALLAGSIVMGLSIAAMHYTGMAAMQLQAIPRYDPKLVALSIVIAITTSLIALWLAFHLRTETKGLRAGVLKLVSAIAMGNAIAEMHYTAMAAVHFHSGLTPILAAESALGQPATAGGSSPRIDIALLAVGVGIATLVILTLALLASFVDQRISAEAATAEALRESESRFRSLVQNSSDIIAVVAADGTVGYTSQSIERILGYQPEDWQKMLALVYPDDLAKAESLLTDSLHCPAVSITAEFRLQTASGSWRDFAVVVNNLLAEPGVNGIVTTYRDITIRKRVEEALQQQAEREKLVAEITQRVRRSLNLEEILNTTVSEVRQFLQTEQVFIYRFEPGWSGTVVVESVEPPWPSIVGTQLKDFFAEAAGRELYRRGRVQAVADIHTAGLPPYQTNLLVQLQVRASLVVPILQEEKLWGLLVANRCSGPRQWQPLEITLLQQLETQLAIAIQQSELYHQAQTELQERKRAEKALQTVNEELELRVAQRTAELSSVNERLLSEITDRRQAEAALQESQRRLSNLIDSLPGIAFSCSNDPQWSMRYLSEGCLLLTGYRSEELLGNAYNAITHPQDLPKLIKTINVAIAEKQCYVCEYRVQAKDGQQKWLWEKGCGVFDEGDKVLGLEGFITDITELKQAQEALKAQRVFLRNIIDTAPNCIFVKDCQGRYTLVNQATADLFGTSVEDLIGKTDADVKTNPGEVQPFFRDDHEVMETLEEKRIPEETVIDSLGQIRWFQTIKKPLISLDGQAHQLLGMATDISARKQAQEALQIAHNELEVRVQARTVELEAANKDLEAFSYSVSHDLRAPLRAITGFSRILLKEHAPQLSPAARRYLQKVQENAQQMGCLVDDLLTFSRLGRSLPKKQPVVLDELIRQVLAELHHEQQGRQIDLAIAQLPTCQADPALLKQVWINLLANALKFTRQRQEARIEIGCQQNDLTTTVTPGPIYFIKDNGLGFDMRYAHKLFGVFQRLHPTEEYEGTGVGLAIVQRIIQRHQGWIWAEAAINQGATFYFTLGGEAHDSDCRRNPACGR